MAILLFGHNRIKGANHMSPMWINYKLEWIMFLYIIGCFKVA